MIDDLDLSNDAVTSYILRVWREEPPDARIVRVMLKRLPDGERRGFADLESAFRFLRVQFGSDYTMSKRDNQT
jgi:hypothetical protein